MDFRIDQDLPFFGGNALAYLKIYNVLNLIDDSWGVQYDNEFFAQVAVDMSLDAQGRYVFEEFNNRTITDLREQATLYQIRMGLQIDF